MKHPAVLVVGDDDVAHHSGGLRIRGADERRGVALGEIVDELVEICRPPR